MPVRIGLIGCGRVATDRHLPALKKIRDAEVVAVSDVDVARLQTVADQFNVAGRYADYPELISAGEVDAVAVCVPPQFHAEVALATLDAGKHLFVEKPLALSLSDCDLLIERAAAKAQVKAMVGFNLRWHRLVREAREIIRGGGLGALKMAQTVFTAGTRYREGYPGWRRQRETGGGVLSELAVHHFDLLRFLLGTEIAEVFAASRDDGETATVSARMTDGVLVSAAFCEGTGDNHEIEIFGQKARLHVSCYRFDGLEETATKDHPGAPGTRLRKGARTLRELPQMLRQARQGGDYVASYAAEWRHFVAAIEHDIPVESTLEDGRRALEVVLAAEQSSSLGRTVKIKDEG